MASLFFAHHCAYSTGLSIPLTCKSAMCVVFDARVCVHTMASAHVCVCQLNTLIDVSLDRTS